MNENDSRERLAADIDAFVLCIENEAKQYTPSLNGYGTREKLDDLVRGLKARMLEVADRQAAITAEEAADAWADYSDSVQREIAELQEQVDELTRENARLSGDELYHRAEAQAAKAERDEWKRVYAKLADDYGKLALVDEKR